MIGFQGLCQKVGKSGGKWVKYIQFGLCLCNVLLVLNGYKINGTQLKMKEKIEIYELGGYRLRYKDEYVGKYGVGDKFVNPGGILEIVAVERDSYVVRVEPYIKDLRVSMETFDKMCSDGDWVPLTEYDGVKTEAESMKTEAEWAR